MSSTIPRVRMAGLAIPGNDMTLLQAIILGAVQGITEFFPISSSGHLVIIQGLFGMKEPMLAFDIFLHLGTTAAVLIYFRKDIIDILTKDRRIALYIAVASIPTFIIGFMFKEVVEELFTRPHIVGYMLLATGALLITSSFYTRFTRRESTKKIGWVNSLIVGTAQGIAIIPGISRSGATITSGILSGIDKEQAFKFSFLLSIPAVLGASVLKAPKIGAGLTSGEFIYFTVGALAAMIVGLFSVSVLLKIVKANKLYFFGIYCILAAALIIVLL